MQLCRHDSLESFATAARSLYDSDPLRHTVALSVLDGFDAAPATGLTGTEDGTVVAALLRTAGRPALVSGVAPEFAQAVVAVLVDDLADDPPGVAGPVPEAEAFAAAWSARTRATARVGVRMRLFALEELTPPSGVVGRARRGGAADLAVIAGWLRRFGEELEHHGTINPEQDAAAALRLGYGLLLWEVDGIPVALASARRPVAGMVRIGPVYTDPAHRSHGYAAAVTAAAARWALDAGARHVLLFTDADNAATNRLYPRIGFRFRFEALEIVFGR